LGALEQEVEFMPDIADRYAFNFEGLNLTCGGFLQSYTPTTGQARGVFTDGRTAVVENSYKLGHALLVGSHPSVSHFRETTSDSKTYFKKLLSWAGVTQQIESSNQYVQARLQVGDGRYLWLVNASASEQHGHVSLRDGSAEQVAWHWGEHSSNYIDGRFKIAAKDVIIVRLQD